MYIIVTLCLCRLYEHVLYAVVTTRPTMCIECTFQVANRTFLKITCVIYKNVIYKNVRIATRNVHSMKSVVRYDNTPTRRTTCRGTSACPMYISYVLRLYFENILCMYVLMYMQSKFSTYLRRTYHMNIQWTSYHTYWVYILYMTYVRFVVYLLAHKASRANR